MKRLRNVFALLMALVMVIGLGTAAFAENGDVTITFPKETGDNTYSYSIYQIMTGSVSGTSIGNAKWGQNAKDYTAGSSTAVPEATINALAALASSSDVEKLAEITKYVDLESEPITSVTTSKTEATTVTVAPGYYLIKQTSAAATGEEVSQYIVEVANSITVTRKADGTTPTKKVKDINDGLNRETTWQDSADYDIGDSVPFQLTANITDKYSEYTSYALTFHDTLSEGLILNKESIRVYVGTTALTNPSTGDPYYTVVTKEEDSSLDCTFEVRFADLKKVEGVTIDAGSNIYVEYNAWLGGQNGANADQVVVGSTGNPNTLKLTFSNNPNSTDIGNSTEDKVIVFTYELDASKIDGADKSALAGATFQLQKKDKNGNWQNVGEAQAGAGDSKNAFNWSGLDDGDYKLIETVTPEGYNTMNDIEFKIEAEHDTTSDNPALTSLVIKDKDGNVVSSGDKASFTVTLDNEKPTGGITTNLVNNKGAGLPETGATGTMIFIVVGTVMTVGFAVLMITRKKMSIYED